MYGIFDLGYRAIWMAQDFKQQLVRKNMDSEFRDFIYDRYRDAKQTYIKNRKEWDDKLFYLDTSPYKGTYYLLYANSPTSVEMYSSYTEEHRDNVASKIEKVWNIKTSSGKISMKEPIPIQSLLDGITFPDEEMFVGNGKDGYPMKMILGMWPSAKH